MAYCVAKVVLKEILDCWREPLGKKIVWRSARTMLGAQCVTLDGILLMLEWCVDS